MSRRRVDVEIELPLRLSRKFLQASKKPSYGIEVYNVETSMVSKRGL